MEESQERKKKKGEEEKQRVEENRECEAGIPKAAKKEKRRNWE